MGTIIDYTSTVKTYVKPNIVKIDINVIDKADTSKEVANNINEHRKLITNFIVNKNSYQIDSLKQNDFSLVKINTKETWYKNVDNDEKISELQYRTLHKEESLKYIPYIEEKFLYYKAQLSLSFILVQNNTVVNDLVSIFNMCIENDFYCNYTHTISDDLYESIMHDLYAECINKGMTDIKCIINQLNYTNDIDTIKLNNIKESNNDYSPIAKYASFDSCSSTYKPEQIIIPELVEELFNNNIEFEKSLDLQLEF